MAEDSSIKVAVRIRPQIAREIIDLCRVCTTVVPGEPQITLGTDKSFTYDYVFDVNDDQQTVYEKCAATLVEGSLEGYNATVLAYGQTGSGKTYTMGTGFDVESEPHLIGILPRAINQLFDGIKNIQKKAIQNGDPSPAFTIYAQFLELYNEEVIDLFDPSKEFAVTKCKSGIKIHEDSNRSIYLTGVTSKAIHSADEALQCLREGALSRTTASTQMNSHSSRSHAIFTLHIEQKKIVTIQQNGNTEIGLTDDGQEFETLKAKFHFVDLAGSERLKRTMATGDRAKEGISINCGLLALGNVISALGDKSKKAQHVPYRDAKLTRLLQDSLGGNSRTVMIACISPSDRDFMETLNTLKYANRARNIQNKVIVNQDKSSRTIMMLRQEIQELKTALLEYKQGKRVMNEDGEETVNDTYIENTMLQTELSNMRTRMKALQETVDSLTMKNSELLTEREINAWIRNGNTGDEGDKRMEEMIREYLKEIGDLRTNLLESEYTCELLRKQAKTSRQTLTNNSISIYDKEDETMVDNLLAIAKKDLEREKKLVNRRKSFNDDVNGEENSGSDDEDNSQSDEDEEEDNNSVYSQELADITSEINVKQSLIDKLEATQKRLQKMKQDYEDKLHQLQTQIKRTQEERDTVLASFSGKHSQNTDKAKEIKDGYEVKINKLQREVRNLQTAKKEHARLLRSQSYNENQLKTLRSELAEMKRAKVKLFNKMKEEATRHREEQIRHNREIAQLRKESRKNENLIRSLETKNRTKDVVLKRKTEEVSALRKVNRNVGLSDKAAGRFGIQKGNMLAVSPKAAKQKWQLLEKNIAAITVNKQAVVGIERNMDRLIEQRNTLNARLKEKNAKLSEIERSYPKDRVQKKELEEEIENIQENMRYVEDSIKEAQENLLDLDEPKLTVGSSDILSSLTNAEATYVMNKLYNLANFYSMQATLKDISCKELQTKLSQIKRESVMHEQLLQHMLERQGISDNVAEDRSSASESPVSSRSASPLSHATSSSTGDGNQTISIRPGDQTGKVRRRTAMPEELLYDENSKSQQNNEAHVSNNNFAIMKAPSTSSVNKYMVRSDAVKPSPIMSRKTYDRQESTSPRINRRMFNNTSNNLFGKPGSMNLRINDDMSKSIYTNGFSSDALKRKPIFMTRDRGLDKTPPNSPPAYRRFNSKEENVFSRLTSSSVQSTEQIKTKGAIKEYNGKSNLKAPLVCTHVVEGHTKAVLGLHATDYLLFSASKDRTVKVWDLHEGVEMSTLVGHPNNVTSVKFNERDWLIYSVSSAYIKVWDLRVSRCVKTLSSSGIANSMTTSNSTASSQLPFGETQINDISISEDNSQLFVAAGDKVKIWDIRKYGLIGKLSGGHQAAVMCLAVQKDLNGDNLVITGSKDHYVRLFEVPGHGVGSFSPKVSLDPPHYDGVQSLALKDNILFSGSRDFVIKKWDLERKELVNSLSNAHRDWICGLALVNKQPILLSVCRSGTLKLWNTDTCTLIGEMKAHDSSINAIVTNSSLAFTAAHDNAIKIWKLNNKREYSIYNDS